MILAPIFCMGALDIILWCQVETSTNNPPPEIVPNNGNYKMPQFLPNGAHYLWVFL